MKKNTLVKGLIGLIALIIVFEMPFMCNNNRKKQIRYDSAMSTAKQLIEYDGIKGTSQKEWQSLYNRAGVHYDPQNPQELTLEQLESINRSFGYNWNGKKHTK